MGMCGGKGHIIEIVCCVPTFLKASVHRTLDSSTSRSLPPRASNTSAVAKASAPTASCSGVLPKWSTAEASAPESSSKLTTAVWPLQLARCSACEVC